MFTILQCLCSSEIAKTCFIFQFVLKTSVVSRPFFSKGSFVYFDS